MRVLILNDYGTLSGGAEHMSVSLREGLRQRGHDARIFATTARPIDAENVADYTCFGTFSPLQRVLQAGNPWAAARLRSVLTSFRPDVVHVRLFLTQLSPLILPLLRSVPSLFHVVNYFPICPIGTKLLPDNTACHVEAGPVCRKNGCLSWAGYARMKVQMGLWDRWRDAFDQVIANSAWTQRRLIDDGVHVDDYIWNGVPVQPARPLLGAPPTITFTGRLYPKKGVDVLLKAMRQVVRHLPQAQLLVAGDGPDRPRLERLVAELGLTTQVTLLGHRPRAELEHLLASGWVQAVPSLWEEPFGLVAAEAMMRGTAVVASRSGGLSEMVYHGETGFAVPPGDPDALGHALLNLLSNRKEAERMGRAGRTLALAELTEDCVVERFLQVYQDLLYHTSRRSPSSVPS